MKTNDMPTFTVEINAREQFDILKISGDLAIDAIDILQKKTRDLQSINDRPIVIDLSGLRFIDSRGICSLVRIKTASGKNVAFASAPPQIREILSITMTLDLLKPHRNVQAAKKAAFAA